MKRFFLILTFFVYLSGVALANPKMGFELGYGMAGHTRMWGGVKADTGNALKVAYLFKPNDRYTLALETALIADSNVFNSKFNNDYVQTASYLKIKNLLYFNRIDNFLPYVHIGTGLYGTNVWEKKNNSFTFSGSDTFADISLGLGSDIILWNMLFNIDLTFEALGHTYFSNSLFQRTPMVLSFGVKYLFDF